MLLLAMATLDVAWVAAQQPPPQSSEEGATEHRDARFPLRVLTEDGRYQLTLRPPLDTVPMRQLHDWSLQVSDATRSSVDGILQVGVDGGMRAHGHGLPSKPAVVSLQSAGEFRIEGLQFGMPGEWNLTIGVLDGDGWHVADIALELQLGERVIATERAPASNQMESWTGTECAAIKSMSLSALKPSEVGRHSQAMVELGWRLFFEPGLSASGEVACASCHLPERAFAGAEPMRAGPGATLRDAPSLIGVAHQQWFYWDGRRDSLWSQALAPMEAPGEMAATRLDILHYLGKDDDYRQRYEALFGTFPVLPEHVRASPIGDAQAAAAWASLPASRQQAINRAFANVGVAIAAYESALRPGQSRFDRYADALQCATPGASAPPSLSSAEVEGLKLFLSDRLQCSNCHNGPLLTHGGFQNIGTGTLSGDNADFGRLIGVQAVLLDEFNCSGAYTPDKVAAPTTGACGKLEHLDQGQHNALAGAFKVPGLRNVAKTGPYMHDGRYATLEKAIAHYRQPLGAPGAGNDDIRAVPDLSAAEISRLSAFLATLDAPPFIDERWSWPPERD